MGKINREWHQAHRMPAKPTREQRGAWHASHVAECGCRTPSEAEALLIAEYKAKHSA